jgi:hypothetical protein
MDCNGYPTSLTQKYMKIFLLQCCYMIGRLPDYWIGEFFRLNRVEAISEKDIANHD